MKTHRLLLYFPDCSSSSWFILIVSSMFCIAGYFSNFLLKLVRKMRMGRSNKSAVLLCVCFRWVPFLTTTTLLLSFLCKWLSFLIYLTYHGYLSTNAACLSFHSPIFNYYYIIFIHLQASSQLFIHLPHTHICVIIRNRGCIWEHGDISLLQHIQ